MTQNATSHIKDVYYTASCQKKRSHPYKDNSIKNSYTIVNPNNQDTLQESIITLTHDGLRLYITLSHNNLHPSWNTTSLTDAKHIINTLSSHYPFQPYDKQYEDITIRHTLEQHCTIKLSLILQGENNAILSTKHAYGPIYGINYKNFSKKDKIIDSFYCDFIIDRYEQKFTTHEKLTIIKGLKHEAFYQHNITEIARKMAILNNYRTYLITINEFYMLIKNLFIQPKEPKQ